MPASPDLQLAGPDWTGASPSPSPVHELQDRLRQAALQIPVTREFSPRRKAALIVGTSLGLWALIALAGRVVFHLV